MMRSTVTAGDAEPGHAAPRGPRPFVVEDRRRESDIITSFILRPLDGAPLPHYRAGQHLTLFADIPARGRQKRNYTVSTAPNGETYRISVKREANGIVSRWLHDEAVAGMSLDVAPPSGAFVLPEQADRPIVLVSAGVGLTPMVAMLEEIVRSDVRAQVRYVHCTRNGATHAFRDHVRELAQQAGDVTTTTFYSQPRDQDEAGRDYDVRGRLTVDWLATHAPVGRAEYFVCGPLGFIRDMVQGLHRRGVPVGGLHYEFFGPITDVLGEEESVEAPAAPAAQPVAERHTRVIGTLARDQIGGVLLDSAADAVVASDADGAIVAWNAGAERIFGFTEQEALGQSLDIIIPEPFRARHWQGYRETVASGQSRYGAGDMLAVPGLRKDGKRISLEFTIVLLKNPEGRVAGMVATIRDITARFEELKALRKQVMKDVAHD